MKALKQLYIAVLVLVVGLILIPLFKTESTTQELKGFSARDIQFLESTGFVDNLDGSWSLNVSSLTVLGNYYYEFDFWGYYNGYQISHFRVNTTTQIQLIAYGVRQEFVNGGTLTIWGGDVS